MKNIFLSVSLLFIVLQGLGQDENLTPLINEVYVSINKVVSNDNNVIGNIGFGVGARIDLVNNPWFYMSSGFEINRISQFLKYYDLSQFISVSDVTINSTLFSFPLLFGVSVGNVTKVKFESGVFIDSPIRTTFSGQRNIHFMSYREEKYRDMERLGPGLGPLIGIGIDIPVKKYTLIFRGQYKHGLQEYGSLYNFHMRYASLSLGLNF